jgi:hypothetical protein
MKRCELVDCCASSSRCREVEESVCHSPQTLLTTPDACSRHYPCWGCSMLAFFSVLVYTLAFTDVDNNTLNVDMCGDYIHRHPRLDLPWRC